MARALVVGGGIIGLACAYALRRRGLDVTVLERGRPGEGCSGGNNGWIVPSFSSPLPGPGVVRRSLAWMPSRSSPLYIKPRADVDLVRWLWAFWRHCNTQAHERGLRALAALNAQTGALFDAWLADGIHCELQRTGVVFACLTEAGLRHLHGDLDAMRPSGYHPAALTGHEIRALIPRLTPHVIGGCFVAQEKHLRPEDLVRALLERLRGLRCEVRSGTDVLGLEVEDAVVTGVATRGERLAADAVVVAAGVWSPHLTRPLGLRLPVAAGKGYSMTIPHPDLLLPHALYLTEARVACSPFADALRIGGTMEFSGLNSAIDRRRLRAMARGTDRYLRGWRSGHGAVAEWAGLRPMTPDGLPLIGKVDGWENLYVATGHGMLGITLTPATGELIAGLICREQLLCDPAPFRPSRFSQAPAGRSEQVS